MKNIYLWGAGLWAEYVHGKVLKKNCVIHGVIDNDVNKQGKEWKYGLKVFSPDYLLTQSYDYILITPKKYEVICKQCKEMNISEQKVLAYWRDNESQCVFENRSRYILSVENECNKYKRRWANARYEYGFENTPIVKSGIELLKHILTAKTSLSRFGDGEFELMLERPRPWFQNVDKHLAERLKEIIRADVDENVVVAIADNFGNLDKFNEASADIIRDYISENTRENIMQFIDLDRQYYDAYVTRPYILYKDGKNAELIFDLFKKIFKDRNIILVEGKYARIGMGNDLLSGALSVKRILCPQQNSWDKYKEIMRCIIDTVQEDDLICISLGPTATVMAYDLAKKGMQALDIGQVDNEYDWYLQGAVQRIAIDGKMVAEIDKHMVAKNVENQEYLSQIIVEIG